MIKSKEWAWENVKENIWLEPCEESYFYANKWKRNGKKSILDLGCGLGRHSILFAQHGFKVTAIDLSDYGVNHLREWQKKEQLDILSKVCDMNVLPFQDNAFDCVWAYHVISHTDTEGFQGILSEIKRVLKHEGEIYLTLCSKETVSFKDGIHPIIDENTVLKSEGEAEVEMPHYYVDLKDVLRLFEDFDIERIRHIDDCYYDHDIRNSMHYYLTAKIKKEKQTLNYDHIIGTFVNGTIDRKLGSHHPNYPKIKYDVNYGYVDGVIGGDGSEQDVYYLGETLPVDSFQGKVIAVIHRYNDLESKWIVSKNGQNFTNEEILEQVNFQEKYFDIEIIR